MEEREHRRTDIPLFADLALAAAALGSTVYQTGVMADGLSFGGFFVLFLLLLLKLCYLGLIGALFLVPWSIKTRKARFAAIGAVLQILSPIPWLGLCLAFGYESFQWCELVMLAGIAAGIALLFYLPVWRKAGRGT